MKTVVINSGYFNPIHIGHITMLRESKAMGDYLVVIINNDIQQKIKKGKIIMDQNERAQIVEAIKYVDEIVMSIDEDSSICKTLEMVAEKFKDSKLIFANGGDRNSSKVVPEAGVCEKFGITSVYDAGTIKENSSTNINKKLGRE